MSSSASPSRIRIFVSSTFDDFVEERNMLWDTVVPSLNANCMEAGLEFSLIDLRWGITQAQGESGGVLGQCLDAIDDCQPWFVGLIGNRYGWVPPAGEFPPALLARHPWLAGHAGRTSATELEVLHGVLNRPPGTVKALFLLRDAAFAPRHGLDMFLSTSTPAPARADDRRVASLRDRILRSGSTVIPDYKDPGHFLKLVQPALHDLVSRSLDASRVAAARHPLLFPHQRRSARLREFRLARPEVDGRLHAAAAAGGCVVLEGGEGSGKSSLLAHLAGRLEAEGHHAFLHYSGRVGDREARDVLANHLHHWLTTGWAFSLPDQPSERDPLDGWRSMFEFMAEHAAGASRFFLLVDGAERLKTPDDLRWAARHLPAGVTLVVSTADPSVSRALEAVDAALNVPQFSEGERRLLLEASLAREHRALDPELRDLIVSAPAASNPQGLTLIVDELKIAARHSALGTSVAYYADCAGLEDVYERVLERLDALFSKGELRDSLSLVSLSRATLLEDDLEELCGVGRTSFRVVRLALGGAVAGGEDAPLALTSHALRQAVARKYLAQPSEVRGLHRWLSAFLPAEAVREKLHHLRQGGDARGLRALLLDPVAFLPETTPGANDLQEFWRALDVDASELAAPYREAWHQWQASCGEGKLWLAARNLADFLLAAGACDIGFIGTLYNVAVQGVQRLLHEPHDPQKFLTTAAFGRFMLKLGRSDDAITLLNAAVSMGSEALGETHGDVMRVINNLGFALLQDGQLEEAADVFQHVLELRTRIHGDCHTDVAQCMMNLAQVRLRLKEFGEAEALLRSALAIRESVLAKTHPDLALTKMTYGEVLLASGHQKKARPWLADAADSLEHSVGARHEYTLAARKLLDQAQ